MMRWRVEKTFVQTKVWGPEDTYEVAASTENQVHGFRRGETIYRVVSGYTNDDEIAEQMREFVEVMNNVEAL